MFVFSKDLPFAVAEEHDQPKLFDALLVLFAVPRRSPSSSDVCFVRDDRRQSDLLGPFVSDILLSSAKNVSPLAVIDKIARRNSHRGIPRDLEKHANPWIQSIYKTFPQKIFFACKRPQEPPFGARETRHRSNCTSKPLPRAACPSLQPPKNLLITGCGGL